MSSHSPSMWNSLRLWMELVVSGCHTNISPQQGPGTCTDSLSSQLFHYHFPHHLHPLVLSSFCPQTDPLGLSLIHLRKMTFAVFLMIKKTMLTVKVHFETGFSSVR